MSRGGVNGEDIGLSLAGSQITTPVSSARRGGSSHGSRPNSSAGSKQATPGTPGGKIRRSGSSGQLSQRSDVTAGGDIGRKPSARDDLLSFFESTPVQPKIRKPQPKQKTQKPPKPAWGSASNSARSTSTVNSARSAIKSQASKASSSKFSHSVFQPTSARSNSTEDDEEFNSLMSKINQSEKDLELDSVVSELSTHRYAAVGGDAMGNQLIERSHNSDMAANHLLERIQRSPRSPRQMDLPVRNNVSANSLSIRTRNLSHGDNDLSLSSPNDFLNEKATKLNSIANNMTSQGMPGAAKTPLENSLQNIKHKTPVNQVKDTASRANHQNVNSMGLNRHLQRQDSRSNKVSAEDLVKRREMSAIIIQRWFRRHQCRHKAGEAALRRLLDTKKSQIIAERETEVQQGRNREEDRKKSREEKARQARQDAIQELQKKREAKRLENKRISEEEISYLQANGKISKTPTSKLNVNKKNKTKVGSNNKPVIDSDSDASPERAGAAASSRGATGGASSRPSSVRKRADDMFKSSEVSRTVNGYHEHNGADEDQRSDSTLNNNLQDATTPRTSRGDDNNSTVTPSHAGTKTTIDDLMATLKKLEEDDTFEKYSARSGENNKNEKPLAWLDDLEKKESDKKDDYLSTDKLERLDKDNLKKSGLLTDEKLRNIMTYLDEVETAERLSLIDQELSHTNDALPRPALLVPSGEELVQMEQASANAAEELIRCNGVLEKPALLLPSGEEIAELEQASAYAAEVTNTVLSQKMELEEKKRTVTILQKALNQQRELTVRHARETEKEMKRRLDIQKDEYEETIKRHLSFIDQLIDDKKALGEKCETLVKELKLVDKKYGDKLKTMQENHDLELRKVKEVQAAAEKLRREKWIDEKTKKIKEMTVKGLEPEIQRLIAKHKGEIKKLKSIHEAELLASDERAGGKYIRMTEELRDQLAHEKELACSRERELARQTYEKQMQQEEEAYQQQRRRLYSEVQEEKERVAQGASRQRQELDRLQRQLEDQHGTSVEAMRTQYEKAREEQEKRHESELRQIKEQVAIEKAAWEENYMKKQDSWAMQKERELKEAVRRERDKEIELVISRLEEDSQNGRDECERVADNRIKRIRDKYEAEMSELERSERQTMEKYNQTKAKLAELEGENERMKVTLRQKDKEIIELKKLLEKLNEERSHVSDVIRQEFADKIVATDEENKRIKHSMSELKARHKIEIERGKAEIEIVQKGKEEEMEEVHKRVKQAILKKEEVVNQLRQQHQAAVKRADHLEGLLEQQRKQLLGKK